MGNHGNAFLSFGQIVELFASLYESFQALTSIQVTHFVEWFSGSVLDSIWATVGSGTKLMSDNIDGGLSMVSTGANGEVNAIWFNNLARHYSPTDSILIGIMQMISTSDSNQSMGFTGNATNPSTEISAVDMNRNATFYRLVTGDASANSSEDSDIAVDSSVHVHKIENGSANIKLFIDGVIKVTKTTNRPTAKLQPWIRTTNLAAASKETRIRYLECFNTSVTILSSLTERLSALTQVMKQRVVENFVGSVLNERWTSNNITGTNTFQMADVVDGGFEIITGTTANDDGSISFNDKRQYAFDASIIIFVMQQITVASYRCLAGFSDSNNLPSGDSAYIDNNTSFTNYRLLTFRLGGGTATSLGVAIDQLLHSFKVETKTSSVEGSMDGVLKATNTTNLPNVKMQPVFQVKTLTTASKTGRIRYLEAYNRLTSQTVYPSVYELFNKLTTIAKSHFWEWFDGDQLHNRWTETDEAGSGSGAMVDAIDGGYQLIAGTGSNDARKLWFNDKRPFEPTGCVSIIIVKHQTNSNVNVVHGLNNSPPGGHRIQGGTKSSADSFFAFQTAGASITSTLTDVSNDTIFHVHKVEMLDAGAKAEYTIDGVIKATHTTNLPTLKLQPYLRALSKTSNLARPHVRFWEIYNT